jgi:Ca2+-binding RTX toxin-like protein
MAPGNNKTKRNVLMIIDFSGAASSVISDFYFDANLKTISQLLEPGGTTSQLTFGHATALGTAKIEVTGNGLGLGLSGSFSKGTITGIKFIELGATAAEISDINWAASDFLDALNKVETKNSINPLVNFLSTDPITIRALDASSQLTMDDSLIFSAPLKHDTFIQGSAFDDHLIGGNKQDTVHGYDGNDTVIGGKSNDILFGDNGDDILRGGSGSDLMEGGRGNDKIYGGAGDEIMFGSGGKDKMFGGTGSDNMEGEKGNDVLKGQAGIDGLYGGQGKDAMYGGAGADTLNGGAGNDKMVGGSGADTFIFNKGDEVDQITDFATGVDTLQLDTGMWTGQTLTTQQVVTMFAQDTGTDIVFDFGNGDQLTLTGVASLTGLAADLMLV